MNGLVSYKLVSKGSVQVLNQRPEALHLLQGETFDAADPQLVVGALAGERRHVHEEVLGLGGGAGRRLAQSVGHMFVGVLPLVAGERRARWGRDSGPSIRASVSTNH